MIEIDTNFWINRVIVRRGYNTNTISWKEAFYNLNDSISKNESVSAVGYTRRFVIGKNIEDAIRKNAGFFVSYNAERISLVPDVLNDLECLVAHLYIGIDVTNPGFGRHNDKTDVWFWQNKGISRWDFDNGDSYTLNEGDLIYVPEGVYHKVSTVEARFGISMSLK
tara:strand:+ start:484 stop:981 length:498 start_codon:yes stop_codon:yes gene_type:complete